MAKIFIESNVIKYTDVKKITGFTCEIKGENDTCYYTKEFKYSTDNILWSDYRPLTNERLGKINVEKDDTLYIQYRFTQVGTGDLSVENISLNIIHNTDVDNPIPNCYWKMGKQNRYSPQIVYNQSSQNIFNPYALGNATQIYQQLTTVMVNMYGICVQYFKTEANSKTRDVVLKEYSIEHVIDKQNIKIIIPDNQLPTKELQFNSMMIDYPVQFEVHVSKVEFQKAFGSNSHPDPHDYLYFQTYMNKMYMVDSVSDPDDFGYTNAYWRVSLVPYQELSSLKYQSDDLQEDTETLIFSTEGKFEDEIEKEFEDTTKPNQLQDIGDWQEGQDPLRRFIDPNVRIKPEKVYNDWTMVSDSYYDLSTIDKGQIANEYKYKSGFTSSDERMLSFMFKPLNIDKNTGENIMIKSVSIGDNGGVKLTVAKWNKIFEVGNIVKISKTNDLNGYKKIIHVNQKQKTIEVNGKYTGKTKLLNCAKVTGYEYNNMFTIRNKNKNLLEISQIPDQIILHLSNNDYYYTFDDFKGFENKWYCVMLGMKNGMSNIWLYEFDGSEKDENVKSKMKLIGKSSNDLGKYDLGDTCYYDIMSCNLKLTNIRLWSQLCEEDKQELILSQYIIDDTHNTLIVDNAKSELLLNNKWS